MNKYTTSFSLDDDESSLPDGSDALDTVSLLKDCASDGSIIFHTEQVFVKEGFSSVPIRLLQSWKHGLLRSNKKLRSYESMTSDTVEATDGTRIERTVSGGRFFSRQKSSEEQRLMVQQRADHLMAQYELSEDKDESLNRHAEFGPAPIPAWGACLGFHFAALAAVSDNHSFCLNQKDVEDSDNYTNDDAMKKQQRLPFRSVENTFFTFDNVATKKKSRGQQRIEKARAARMRLQATACTNDRSACTGCVVAAISPGAVSTATEPTMATTPTPRPVLPGSRLHATREFHRLC